MKKIIRITLVIFTIVVAPTLVLAGGVKLKYKFVPGQQWECTRKTHMAFEVMGQKQVQRQNHTVLYTASKGKKKGWVHLTAQYINPPPKTPENQFALGQYDLLFSADVHSSGDTRNIQVEDTQKDKSDPSLPPQMQAALDQNKKMLAESLKQTVFWFPEVPEYALVPGDEFEEKSTQGVKTDGMQNKSKTRTVFELDDVSDGLAYFVTKQRSASKMSTMGGNMDYGSSGKGEIIFDIKEGMWIEYVSKSKMKFSGAMMGQGGQDMLITEKISMQKR
jgi:hypothetical protein